MAREVKKANTVTYLRLNRNGQLSTQTKTEREGYTKVETDKGHYYEKVFSGTEVGKITYMDIEEKTFATGSVKFIAFYITSLDGESADKVEFPLKSVKGGLSDTAKKFIALLPSINYEKPITFSSNRKANEKGFVDRLLFANYSDDNGSLNELYSVKFSLKFSKEGGNVPPGVPTESMDGESVEWDFKEQDKFVYEVLMYELQRFKDFKKGDIYKSKFIHEDITNYDYTPIEVSENKSNEVTESNVTETKNEEKVVEKKVENKEESNNKKQEEEDDELPF